MSKDTTKIGDKFNDWEILDIFWKPYGDKRTKMVKARCKCGYEADQQLNGVKRGTTKRCRKCASKLQYEKGAHKYFVHPIQTLVGDISGAYMAHIRNGARGRDIDFDLSMEYLWELFLKQDSKCRYSNIPLVIARSYSHKEHRKTHTASLDRIDSSIGYVEGNVQWVHKDVNYMKYKLSGDRFIELCKLVSINN